MQKICNKTKPIFHLQKIPDDVYENISIREMRKTISELMVEMGKDRSYITELLDTIKKKDKEISKMLALSDSERKTLKQEAFVVRLNDEINALRKIIIKKDNLINQILVNNVKTTIHQQGDTQRGPGESPGSYEGVHQRQDKE